MKVSDNFDLRELVHPDIYQHPAIGDRAADFIHPYLPITLEALKTNLNDVLTVNDWHWSGKYKNSGLRSNKQPYGGRVNYSSHYFGTAADCKFRNHSIQEVHEHILGRQDLYPFITRMEALEATPTWCHIEVGERKGDIVIFYP